MNTRITFKVYRTFEDVPLTLLRRLKKLCYPAGIMQMLIGNFQCGEDVNVKRYITVCFDGQVIAAWGLLGGENKVHLWTTRKYRRKGIAPRVAVAMFQAMPKAQAARVAGYNDVSHKQVTIGKYLHLNNL